MEILVLTEGEEATADMIVDAKEVFAELVASWSYEGLMIPYISRDVLVGDTSKASYTWGPGGDINTVAPVDVAAVSFQIENGQIPLSRGDDVLFMQRPWLGIVGQPQYFYFEKATTPLLRFDVAPYGGAFLISSWKKLDNTQVLTDTLTFPDQYARMLRTNLAIELCPPYQKSPSDVLVANAVASKRIVKRYNMKPISSMSTDLPGSYIPSASLPLKTV